MGSVKMRWDGRKWVWMRWGWVWTWFWKGFEWCVIWELYVMGTRADRPIRTGLECGRDGIGRVL